MLDRARFVADILAVWIASQPLFIGEQPYIDAELFEQCDGALNDRGWNEVLLDRPHPGIDDGAAVEGAERQRERERFDQKFHADGWPAGDDGEADAGRTQFLHGVACGLRHALVGGDQRAVDVGDNELDAGHAVLSLSCRTISSTIASTDASIETV